MDDLNARLQQLVHRQDIWQVMLDYARGLDRLDRDLVRSCYWDEAIDDHSVFRGSPDAFIDWAFDFHGTYQKVTHHSLSNHRCEIDGREAHAETYYLFIGQNVEPPHVIGWGRYVDHLQYRDGLWKIANRVCLIEGNFAVSDHEAYQFDAAGPGCPPIVSERSRRDVSYARPVLPRDV